MRKIIETIKNYLGELLVVGGVGVFVYNIFDFGYKKNCYPEHGLGALAGQCRDYVSYYYYTETSLTLITIGAMVFVLGLCALRNRKYFQK